jgi:PAS domain S-box-containing protein
VDPDAWRRALDAVPSAVWLVDRDWHVVGLNRAAERFGGLDAAQALGHDVRDYPTARGSDLAAAVAAVLAGGGRQTLRVQHPLTGVWVDVTVEPDPVGARIMVDTVDDLVELERRTRLETAILASVNDGIYGIDPTGRITFVNAAANRLLGYPPGALAGRNGHTALHHTRLDGSAYPENECPLTATVRDGQPRTAEDVLWRADGTALPVEYRATPILGDAGVITGAVVTFRDLTDRLVAADARSAAETALQSLHELQLVLQPPVPHTDDPRLGVYYLPADIAGAGGDLYDWQTLPDDGLHLAVVDVVGKGLIAARDALAVTHALRLLVLAHTDLDQVARQASDLLADAYPDLAATAITAHYDRNAGRLRFTSAGHPPPLLVTPDGTPTYLEASGRPLGWPEAGTDDVIEITVPPGGRVIFYTDGLVEATSNLPAGLANLARLAEATRALPATDAARALVTDTLATATRRDDCLALVLDRPGPTGRVAAR